MVKQYLEYVYFNDALSVSHAALHFAKLRKFYACNETVRAYRYFPRFRLYTQHSDLRSLF